MSRRVGAALLPSNPVRAARDELLPETVLAQHGLVRPWFAQVELGQGVSRLAHVVLYEGTLYAQSTSAMIHAIDAETGRTLWSRRIGRPDRPTMTPDANGDKLAVINGQHLYVVNRFNGATVFEAELKDVPGAGPALSSQHVYVPMVSGMVVAYPLTPAVATGAPPGAKKPQTPEEKAKAEADRLVNGPAIEQKTPPLFCRSYGRAMVQPLVTRDNIGGEYTIWPTDRGYVNLARIDREAENAALMLKYRLNTELKIVARASYLPPDPKVIGDSGVVFVATRDGLVYAIVEEDGSTLWRFTAGEPIVKAPAVIDDRVYVPTELGGMYCLDSKTGKRLWWTPEVEQFVAAGKDRVYAIDRLGRLLVVNAANGAPLDAIAAEGVTTKMANTDTDRIYLVNEGGLIQCLREAEQTTPLWHGKERKDAAKAKPVEVEKPKKEPTTPKEHAAPKPPSPPPEKKPAPEKKTPAKTPKVPLRKRGQQPGTGQPGAGG